MINTIVLAVPSVNQKDQPQFLVAVTNRENLPIQIQVMESPVILIVEERMRQQSLTVRKTLIVYQKAILCVKKTRVSSVKTLHAIQEAK
ncbi:hypothetical protein FACS189443_1490 [Planctomycetales bacterium]|nr:hypothetical protein FACS189443_1490 [Planctomycetales bacterium]